jgi:hypothetical protein
LRASAEDPPTDVEVPWSAEEQAALLAEADRRGVSPDHLVAILTMEALAERAQSARRPQALKPKLTRVK